MSNANRFGIVGLSLLAAGLIVAVPIVVGAAESEKDYLTAEEYIEAAQPYLHLSCEGAWNQANQEADAYIDIINTVSAISFLNHELDIEEVYKQPEDEVEALRVGFYNEIGRLCGDNPHRLLAGVVERALMDSFMNIAPEAVDDFED